MVDVVKGFPSRNRIVWSWLPKNTLVDQGRLKNKKRNDSKSLSKGSNEKIVLQKSDGETRKK